MAIVSVATWALLAVTWRLWVPNVSPFPRVPLFAIGGRIPDWLELVCLGAMLVACLSWCCFTTNSVRRILYLVFTLAGVMLIVANQHRAQAWLYQFLQLSFFASLLPAAALVRFARWQLISIYVFSAWSKLDYTFVHSLGQQFIDVLLSPWAAWMPELSQSMRIGMALAFPIGELLIGLALIGKRSGLVAAWFGIFLHVLLLTILGPWGLGHHWGVLTWNLAFIAMMVVLFLRPQTNSDSPALPKTTQPMRSMGTYLGVAILALPLLEPAGLLDHWPAWQLYAPRNSRAALQLVNVPDERAAELPASLQAFVEADQGSPYRYVDLDAWSLQELNAPIYPQDRFQLGVALGFLAKADLASSAVITLESPAARWTGKRKRTRLHGQAEFLEAAAGFRLQALPE